MKESGDKQDTDIVSFQHNALASSVSPVIASVLPELIGSAEAEPLKLNYFNQLPEDIVPHVIAGFLSSTHQLNLALSYKANLRLLKPILDITPFKTCVAWGEQADVLRLLQESKTKDRHDTPNLLLAVEPFTDYSGRTFTCTAYEYAYWAKDRYMLRMLEAQMDEPTKEAMSRRIDKLEQQGLTYTQHGKTIAGSKYFDITPLKAAYEDYIRIYTVWEQANHPDAGRDAVVTAWMTVGKAQRDLPVHYVNEYFRLDRSFHPTPTFNEEELPRILTLKNWRTNEVKPLFPLRLTESSGLGVDFAFTGRWGVPAGWGGTASALIDLAAVTRLDEVRTNDLIQSRKNLEPSAPSPGKSF